MTDHEHDELDHHHHHHRGGEPAPAVDSRIPDGELSPGDLSRRQFLRTIGVGGVTLAATGMAGVGRASPVSAAEHSSRTRIDDPRRYLWLAGDHHIHTQYSSDAQYKVSQHVDEALRYGLNWMVITDHGRVAHEKVSIDRTYADVVAARSAHPNMLVYQGLEWNIPGGEHGTVFFTPSSNETAILHEFEKNYDGVVVFGSKATATTSEPKALEGIRWMAGQVASGRTAAGLFLANHPSRRGLDAPHEFRNWIDTDPSIAVGMEGAPGHQAAGIAKSASGPEVARGFYDFNPLADSFPGYPLQAYRTFGGFDWMTATVGGFWDSLLAEGRRYFITANSDSHSVYLDSWVRGTKPDGTTVGTADYDNPDSPYYGRYPDPIDTGVQQPGRGDFWPGYYSRTVVGAQTRSYIDVMRAIRDGRLWVVHGDLISGLEVTLIGGGSVATLGGTVTVRRGHSVELVIRVRTTATPNTKGDIPVLRRVDLIAGPVTGPGGDRDAMTAPQTSVVRSFDVPDDHGDIILVHLFHRVDHSFYLRLRGTDGNVSAPGSIEPRLDPVPVDPFSDLWFYANPIFVDVQ